MTSFAAHSLHLIQRLLRRDGSQHTPHAGVETVLDGLTAVAVTEAAMSDTAALGATWPAASAGRAWTRRMTRDRLNRLGELLAAIDAEHPRGALAAAIGASLAGQRATAFVSGPDLLAASDLLAVAAGQHAPLVIHLATRAAAGHAQAIGSGHEAYHAASDHGLFLLFAANVQEAADLTLIARRVSERCLVPGLVAMDVEQTAMAMQDVRLPDDDLVRLFVGQPHAVVETPTEAQRMTLGATRRRVPRLYDLERPLMLSPLQDPESWARGAAGQRPFFARHVAPTLAEAFTTFGAETGRSYDRVIGHRLEDAAIVLVAQGAAIETACSVADAARRDGLGRIGVAGLRCLRPFPAQDLRDALGNAATVAIMERMDTPLAGDGPLARAVQAALEPSRSTPRLVNVHYGLGGLPLRGADLVALIRVLASDPPARLHLGLDFVRPSVYPKQQALADALRRSHPELASAGLRSDDAASRLLPRGATTIAVRRRAGEHESLAGEIAALLHDVLGGHVRSRPAVTWQRFDQPCTDLVIHALEPIGDPGDDVAIDLAVTPVARPDDSETDLVITAPGDASAGPYAVPAPDAASDRVDTLLGALLKLVVERSELPSPSEARLREARATGLVDMPDALRDTRLDAFVAGFESVRRMDGPPPRTGRSSRAEDVPSSRPARSASSEPTVHSLARFWDHAGVLYHAGRPHDLAADPALTTGAVPPLTSTLRDVHGAGDVLPAFDPATYDGRPDLWTSDPDGALAPVVISARSLLEAGIDLAAERGVSADALRAVVAKIAKESNKLFAADPPPMTARHLFEAAFDVVIRKIPNERRPALREAIAAVLEEIGTLPVARTRVFFDEPNRQNPGSGELFSLAVNPDSCKSPRVALSACEGRGLRAVARGPEAVEAARRLWTLWQRLPDTPGATIERARVHAEVGTLAAILLSRHCLHAMAGGDGAEAGSGGRLALARVLALAEFHQQPRVQRHVQEIEILREKLAERIRHTLAEALPTNDLSALAAGLDALGRDDMDLAQLSSKVDSAVTNGHVDGARLGRLVDAARGLAELSWRLTQGPEGLGRARVGLVLAPGAVATWAGAFPFNPFRSPTLVGACDETSHMARGLLEGQLRQALAGFRLMRWARLELDDPDDAADASDRLAGLRVQDLTLEERQLVPPILVVGDDQALDPGELTSLLNTDLPIKVVVLSDAGSAADTGLAVDSFGRYPGGRRFDLALLGLLTRHAFVVQSSTASPDHLADGVLGAMAHDGPALVVVHAPSPQRHGFAVEHLHEQTRLAVTSRAFPLLRFDPAAGGVFGACLDLSGNPMITSQQVVQDGAPLTPVDWAATEARFAEHLTPLDDDAPTPTPIAAFLDLDASARDGRTPFIVRSGAAPETRLRVGPALVRDADARLRYRRTLQELAGVVTPFTAKVRDDLAHELAATHDAELDRLRGEHEIAMADRHRQFQTEATERITQRLLTLASRDPEGASGS